MVVEFEKTDGIPATAASTLIRQTLTSVLILRLAVKGAAGTDLIMADEHVRTPSGLYFPLLCTPTLERLKPVLTQDLLMKDKLTKRVSLSLSRSITNPATSVNPFMYSWPTKTLPRKLYAGFKFVLGAVLVPLRLAGILSLFGACLGLCVLANRLGPGQDKPPSRLQRWLMYPVRLNARLMLHCLGFYWIKTTGTPARAKDAPIIVSNHVHFWEVLYHFYRYGPSALSRKENGAIPGIGSLLQVTRGLFVDRLSPTSRADTLEAIKRRGALAVKDERWPQVLIFPEGTTSNGRAVCTFKQGAFTPGLPVQPIAVKLPYKFFDPCWSVDGPGMNSSILMMCCQFINFMEITYLPVYQPSDDEKADPKLYAKNVRDLIAGKLNLPSSNHSAEDALFQVQVIKNRIPLDQFHTDMHTIQELLQLDFDGAKDLLQRFASAHHKGGRINFEEFCHFLHLPSSDDVKDLFEAFDLDQSGTIDFRQLVLGLSTLNSQPGNPSKVIEDAWKLFDLKQVGFLTEDQLASVMMTGFPTILRDDVSILFKRANTSNDGKLTWDQWQTFWRKHPEYIAIAQSTIAKRTASPSSSSSPAPSTAQ